nr:hypothetical protein [Oscillochloris trichoides]
MSSYAYLISLCREYQQLVDDIQSGMLETDDIRELNGQRTVLHEQVMEEMRRLGKSFTDREHAMRLAFQLARWGGMEAES